MPNMDSFYGNPVSWDGFNCSFKFYTSVHQWGDVTKLEKLRACSWGNVVQFIQKKPIYVRTRYRDLIHALKKRYSLKDPPSTVRKRIKTVKDVVHRGVRYSAHESATDGYPDAGD